MSGLRVKAVRRHLKSMESEGALSIFNRLGKRWIAVAGDALGLQAGDRGRGGRATKRRFVDGQRNRASVVRNVVQGGLVEAFWSVAGCITACLYLVSAPGLEPGTL